MTKAPTGKEQVAVEALKQDLSGLQNGLGSVHQSIEKGDYLGAETRAKTIKDKGASVSEEIQKAIEKTKGRKPKVHAQAHAGQS